MSEDKATTIIIFCWLASLMASIAFWGGIVYIAIHFISKLW